ESSAASYARVRCAIDCDRVRRGAATYIYSYTAIASTMAAGWTGCLRCRDCRRNGQDDIICLRAVCRIDHGQTQRGRQAADMDGRGQSRAIRTRSRWINGRGTGDDTPRHGYDRMDTGGRGSIKSKRGRAILAAHALIWASISRGSDFQIDLLRSDEIYNGCSWGCWLLGLLHM